MRPRLKTFWNGGAAVVVPETEISYAYFAGVMCGGGSVPVVVALPEELPLKP